MYLETRLISVLILLILIISIVYIFYFKYRAQKSLNNSNIKRSNLPTPLNFILSIFLAGIFLVGGVGVMNLLTNNDNKFNSSNKTENYHILNNGELSSEFNYIETEVIKGIRPEYDLSVDYSNDFILYYAKLKDSVTNYFLPKYIIYITYDGDLILEDNYHIKLSLDSNVSKNSMISKYKSDYVTLLLTNIDLINLNISAEIKYIENYITEEEKDEQDENINESFEETSALSSFDFNLNNF